MGGRGTVCLIHLSSLSLAHAHREYACSRKICDDEAGGQTASAFPHWGHKFPPQTLVLPNLDFTPKDFIPQVSVVG